MYQFTAEGVALQERVREYMADFIYPSREQYEQERALVGPNGYVTLMDKLKAAAQSRGLWNLFLPHLAPDEPGTQLSNVDYAPISEQLGRVSFASEALNCSAPDSGNMEILHLYGSPAAKERWLKPLLNGEIRSAFSMTEPAVASSDAANIELRIARDGDEYVLNGTKWFTSGALSERCKVFVVMGVSDPDADHRHGRHSMVVVPKDSPGISFGRQPTLFGYDLPGGHPEVIYDDVKIPLRYMLGGEGQGFAIAQARLGPGRIHHCMRAIGRGEMALELMVARALARETFGRQLADRDTIQQWIAESRIDIDMAREYVLRAAYLMDTVGNISAAQAISGIKVATPELIGRVVDRAIQVHGAAGVTQFTPLAEMSAMLRALRIADGPDEVHKMTIARREIRRYRQAGGTVPDGSAARFH
jgi:acyl-CoA dehydrogenase